MPRNSPQSSLFTERNLCLFVFAYVLALGLFFQLWLVPHYVPQMGYGPDVPIAGNDANFYHLSALKLLGAMKEHGWSAWQFRPDGQAPAGIAAALYYLIGPSPLLLLPVNALLQAFAVFCLLRIGASFGFERTALRLAVLPFIFFPSSLGWLLRITKDSYHTLGLFLMLLAWMRFMSIAEAQDSPRAAVRAAWRQDGLWLLYLSGITLVWLMRPYLLELSAFALFAALCGIFVLGSLSRVARPLVRRHALLGLVLVGMTLTCSLAFNKMHDWVTGSNLDTTNTWRSLALCKNVRNAPDVARDVRCRKPRIYFEIAVSRRLYYLQENHGATSNIDPDSIKSVWDLPTYLPRALVASWLLPTPWQWLSVPPGPSQRMMFAVGIEMLFVYAGYAGLVRRFLALPTGGRLRIGLLVLFSIAFILPDIYTVPNLGTIYRSRFALMMLMATLGWVHWLEWYRHRKLSERSHEGTFGG